MTCGLYNGSLISTRWDEVKLFQCVEISRVKLLLATSSAYEELELSRIYWHCGIYSAEDCNTNTDCCAWLLSASFEDVYRMLHRFSRFANCVASISCLWESMHGSHDIVSEKLSNYRKKKGRRFMMLRNNMQRWLKGQNLINSSPNAPLHVTIHMKNLVMI